MTRVLIVLVCCAAANADLQAAKTKSPVGRHVKNFTLKDYRGKSHSLSDFKKNKLVVVAFLGTECPLAKLYGPRLAAMSEELADRGVAFIGINANRQDSNTEIAAYARIHSIKFPVLKDLGNRVADDMGAVRTPEVFVLDEKRNVRYWGRIDDQYGVGYIRDNPTRHDLSDAIEALLAGKSIAKPTNESVGCHIGRVHQPNPKAKVTYSNQISRLLQKRCVECHRDNEIAPFSLTEYEEVAGWAEMIAEVVRDERMPPWHAAPKHGKFLNDRRLSDAEKKLIYTWVNDGAPQGDPKQIPVPQQYVEGWQLPQKPDLIIPMDDQPFEVPAEGVVRYQYFEVDPKFTEGKWLKMAELLPGNRAVVHHILVFAKPPGSRDIDGTRGFLVGYVPGMRARPFPDGMAKYVPAGSTLVFQVHYTPIGSVQQDVSKLGLVFADPKELTHVVKTTSAVEARFKIPPNADNHRVTANSPRFQQDVQLLGMMPHMHLRGKAFRYEAVFPNGKREILMDVPHYDFNWQTSYRLATAKKLPKGTQVHCVAHFDNSENNLANPDPSKSVRWGDQTWNEMMIGYFDVAYAFDPTKDVTAQIPALVPDRNARIREFYDRLDKNSDGKLTKEELPNKAKIFFSVIDADKNGSISVSELIKGLKTLRGNRRRN